MATTSHFLWTLFVKKESGKAESTECKYLLDCKGGTTSGLTKHHGETHADFIK